MDETIPKDRQARLQPKWGAAQSVIIGMAAFFVPQILIGIALVAIAGFRGVEIEDISGSFDSYIVEFAITLAISVMSAGIVLAYVKRKRQLSELGIFNFQFSKTLYALPAYLFYVAVLFVVFSLLEQYITSINLDQEQNVGFDNLSGLSLIAPFIALVIISPIYEEILFRGFTFNGLAQSIGFFPSALLTSFLFAVAHGQLNVGIDTFILGMISCWLLWSTNSLWPSITLHVIKNFVAFSFLFII